MIKILLINSIVIFLGARMLDGVSIKNYWTAIGVAVVLAILNWLVRPVILFLTLPLTFLTLGLFVLIINAWILMLTDKFVDGLTIKSFWWAFLYGLIISILNGVLFLIF